MRSYHNHLISVASQHVGMQSIRWCCSFLVHLGPHRWHRGIKEGHSKSPLLLVAHLELMQTIDC